MTGQTEAHRPITWLKNEGAWHQMTLGDVEAAGRMLRSQEAEIYRLRVLLLEQLTICKYLSNSICMTDETGANTNPDNIVDSCIEAITKEMGGNQWP